MKVFVMSFVFQILIFTKNLEISLSKDLLNRIVTDLNSTNLGLNIFTMVERVLSSSGRNFCSYTLIADFNFNIDRFIEVFGRSPVIISSPDTEQGSCRLEQCSALIILGTSKHSVRRALDWAHACGLRSFPWLPVVVVNTHMKDVDSREQASTVLLSKALENSAFAFYVVNRLGASTATRIYSKCLYCESGNPGVSLAAILDLDSDLSRAPAVNLFPSNLENFNGHVFRVVSMGWPPLITFAENSSDIPGEEMVPADSLDIRMLNAISTSLNFTYEIRTPVDSQWGVKSESGNWTGTVGTLQREEADFSMILTWLQERYKDISYVRIYTQEPLIIATKKASPTPMHLAIVKPFQGSLWLAILASTFVFGVLLFLAQKVWQGASRGTTSRKSKGYLSIDLAILHTWSILMEQAMPNPPSYQTAKVSLSFWSIFCILLMTTYKSSLTAHLSFPSQGLTLDTLEDLAKKPDYSFGYEPTYGSGYQWLISSENPVVQNAAQRVQIMSLEDNMAAVLRGNHMFLSWKYYIQGIVSAQYTSMHGYTPVHLSKTEYFNYVGYGWGVRLDTSVQRLREAGLVRYWLRELLDSFGRQQRRKFVEERKMRAVNRTQTTIDELLNFQQIIQGRVILGLEHLQGAFYLLFLGCGFAGLAFLGEILAARIMKHCL